MRAALAVVAGYATWTVLWLAGNAGIAAAFPAELDAYNAGGALAAVAPLAIALALSVVCSLVAGLVTAAVARGPRAVTVLALLLLATGIAVQLGVWARMPLWYHLPFLVLILPATVAGGKLRKS